MAEYENSNLLFFQSISIGLPWIFKLQGFVSELINHGIFVNLFNELVTYIQSLFKKNIDNFFTKIELREIQKIFNDK